VNTYPFIFHQQVSHADYHGSAGSLYRLVHNLLL
jgi:hypothetical protein